MPGQPREAAREGAGVELSWWLVFLGKRAREQ